jgi:hypothetical protein
VDNVPEQISGRAGPRRPQRTPQHPREANIAERNRPRGRLLPAEDLRAPLRERQRDRGRAVPLATVTAAGKAAAARRLPPRPRWRRYLRVVSGRLLSTPMGGMTRRGGRRPIRRGAEREGGSAYGIARGRCRAAWAPASLATPSPSRGADRVGITRPLAAVKVVTP